MTPPGHCCPQCVDLLCTGVVCEEPEDCNGDRKYTRPDGACCAGCMSVEPAACNDIDCGPDVTCPQGYVRGDLMGGCCYECLPDPLYCQTPDDCVRAVRPGSCCGCPELVSVRALDDDPCLRPVEASHSVPDECYPEPYCDVICAECPAWGALGCVDNRCVDVPLP